jgi:hypothetical protein
MSKQIINSHNLIHLVSKDFLLRTDGCSTHMHKSVRVYNIIAKYTLSLSKATLQFGHYWRTQFGNTSKIEKS